MIIFDDRFIAQPLQSYICVSKSDTGIGSIQEIVQVKDRGALCWSSGPRTNVHMGQFLKSVHLILHLTEYVITLLMLVVVRINHDVIRP